MLALPSPWTIGHRAWLADTSADATESHKNDLCQRFGLRRETHFRLSTFDFRPLTSRRLTLIKNLKFYILKIKVIYIISYLILIIIMVIKLSFKLRG
jgi:hypothetical protein